MATNDQQPRGVHLVGSLPLGGAEDVFRTASAVLGGHLRRLPDGETGERARWIMWQIPVLANHPQLEAVPGHANPYTGAPVFRLRAGVDPGRLEFERIGYAAAALDSYRVFAHLKQEGVIPRHVRFQVSIPPPSAPTFALVAAESRAAVGPALERRLLAELDQIAAAVPHEELAIQWDVATEVSAWEGRQANVPEQLDVVRQGITEQLARLGMRVPADVELGYHFCYGDYQHKHSKEPDDLGTCVALSNRVSAAVTRQIQWIHMPVPIERDDEDYFTPLKDLRLHPESEVYLGLVHIRDGEKGARRRIATARRVRPEFGVATECGLGRRPPERGGRPDTLDRLLQIHAAVAAPVAW